MRSGESRIRTLLHEGGERLGALGRDARAQALGARLHHDLIVELVVELAEGADVLATEAAVDELPEDDAKGVDVRRPDVVLRLGRLIDGRGTLGVVARQGLVFVARVREVAQLRDPWGEGESGYSEG